MLTLHPELKLSRHVSGVFAALEHGDHHYLDSNRPSGRRGLREEGAQTEPAQGDRQSRALSETGHKVSRARRLTKRFQGNDPWTVDSRIIDSRTTIRESG